MKDWSECLEVERSPGKVSGDICSVTRVPVGLFSRIWKTGRRLTNSWNGFPE